MTVKIGHARIDEKAKAKGGKAGDQTGKELMIQDWYNKEWSTVFRAKDNKVAEKIAKAMEQACANDKIGYDQGQRTTLYKHAEKCNWNIQKITEKCECDCSSLVAVCVNAAGIKVSKDMYTGNQKAVLQATKKFEMLTDSKYLIKPDYLKRGDILLGPGHTAVVLSDGDVPSKAAWYSAIESAKSFNTSFAGVYEVKAAKLNVRNGAGTLKKVMTVLPKGARVRCYGYYTKVLGNAWFYVQFTYKDIVYTGFASASYLTKIS
jgi:hypothetical protein